MMIRKGKEGKGLFNSARHWKNDVVKREDILISSQFIITIKKLCRKKHEHEWNGGEHHQSDLRKIMRSMAGHMNS